MCTKYHPYIVVGTKNIMQEFGKIVILVITVMLFIIIFGNVQAFQTPTTFSITAIVDQYCVGTV